MKTKRKGFMDAATCAPSKPGAFRVFAAEIGAI